MLLAAIGVPAGVVAERVSSKRHGVMGVKTKSLLEEPNCAQALVVKAMDDAATTLNTSDSIFLIRYSLLKVQTFNDQGFCSR